MGCSPASPQCSLLLLPEPPHVKGEGDQGGSPLAQCATVCQGNRGDPKRILCLPYGTSSSSPPPVVLSLGPSRLLTWLGPRVLMSPPGSGDRSWQSSCCLRGAGVQTWGCLCTDALAHVDGGARVTTWACAHACARAAVCAHVGVLAHLLRYVCTRVHRCPLSTRAPPCTCRGTRMHIQQGHGTRGVWDPQQPYGNTECQGT